MQFNLYLLKCVLTAMIFYVNHIIYFGTYTGGFKKKKQSINNQCLCLIIFFCLRSVHAACLQVQRHQDCSKMWSKWTVTKVECFSPVGFWVTNNNLFSLHRHYFTVRDLAGSPSITPFKVVRWVEALCERNTQKNPKTLTISKHFSGWGYKRAKLGVLIA